jgi:hypothetical protein
MTSKIKKIKITLFCFLLFILAVTGFWKIYDWFVENGPEDV